MTSRAEARRPTVVVWGNCQAAPVADLLRDRLATHGLDVPRLPPVYLAGPADLAALRPQLARCAAFVTQPVREAAFGGGRGSDTLAALLPASGVVVTYPISYWTGPFPFQVHGHDASGARADAALTDYHDVRAAVAAHHRLTVEQAVAWWPNPGADLVRERAQASLAELRRREADLDVTTSDLVAGPDTLWTMTHPTNATLGAITDRVLDRLAAAGVCPRPSVPTATPAREFLGARRAPVEPGVAAALGWPTRAVRPQWTIDGTGRPLRDVLAAQLAAYAQRPDVVADVLARHADLVAALPAP